MGEQGRTKHGVLEDPVGRGKLQGEKPRIQMKWEIISYSFFCFFRSLWVCQKGGGDLFDDFCVSFSFLSWVI